MRRRMVVAIAIGIAAGILAWFTQRDMMASGIAPDSMVLWRGARFVMSGANPYDPVVWASRPVGSADSAAWAMSLEPLYYPFPAILVWLPLAVLPFLLASAAFCALGAALFAFAVSRRGIHRVWLCGGVPFIVAIRFGQWSTWLVAASLLPGLAFLLPAKPNLGLALFLARPTRAAVIRCSAILLLSVALLPAWPMGWFRNVTAGLADSGAPHPVPLTQFAGTGVLVLIVLLRWRQRDARLVALLASVPQLPFWADQLLLAPVARTQREVIWTVLAGHLGFLAWFQFAPKVALYVPVMQPYALLATYLPATVLVLLRPNAGHLPGRLERWAARLPGWMRGTPLPRDA